MSITNIGLDALEAIADLGTIASACKRLGVTQTALTQRIKALEAEVGCSLFIRSRKGMRLTQDGSALYLYAKERTQKERLVLQRIQGTVRKDPVRLKLSGPTLQTQRRIFGKLLALKQKHPELFFEFDIDDGEDLLPKLRSGSADFIITSQLPPASVNSKKLEPSEFVLVGPHGWRALRLKAILETKSMIDFNLQDRYTSNFLDHFKLLPPGLNERHFVNNTNQMIMLVEEGLGYAVFDVKDVTGLIRQKKLCNLAPKLKLKVDWYLCWGNYGQESNGIVNSFVRSVE